MPRARGDLAAAAAGEGDGRGQARRTTISAADHEERTAGGRRTRHDDTRIIPVQEDAATRALRARIVDLEIQVQIERCKRTMAEGLLAQLQMAMRAMERPTPGRAS